jgi:protein-glutamine gamma-glutamyltransferase
MFCSSFVNSGKGAFAMTASRDRQPQQAATFLLAALATISLEFARLPYAARPWLGWIATAIALGVAVGAAALFHRRRSAGRESAGIAIALAGIMSLAPFVGAALGRFAWQVGESPEIVQMLAMRNLMLALAAAGAWPSAQRLSGVLSLFLTLGALMFMASWAGYVAILFYGIVGIWWLMGSHWERMQGRFAAASHRQIPLGVGAGSMASVLLVVGLAALTLGGANSTVALGGYFWGSGGTSGNDPFAARGVRDGDQLVAARDEAASFGAVESELFLDSEMPSLYDMFNDMYGEPIRKQKAQERAIGLAASPDPPKQQRTAESRNSGREFAAVRNPPRHRPQSLADQRSPALIYVGGRVPLHLRFESFDTFDGCTWSHAADSKSLRGPVSLRMNEASGKPWCEIARLQESGALCQPELHVVKVMHLTTNRIPTPAHPLGVHIDKVNQRDFYEWTDDDVLAMPGRERIPPLQVIHVQSRSVDVERLPEHEPTPLSAYLATTCTGSAARVEKLAQQWVEGIPRGYPQVAAIATRLRSGEFELNADLTMPEDRADAAEYFLLETQCGPDYLFATGATAMLRSLGYPARVVTGLYANPARYDRLTGQTAVLKDDVHFWVEVCLDGHTWITVEPTPGYEILPPNRTWAEFALIAVRRFATLVKEYPFTVGIVLLIGVVAGFYRRELLSAACTLVWVICQLRPARGRLLATIWLIERRAALAGKGRPRHATLATWYSTLTRACPSRTRAVAAELLKAASRTLYAPQEFAASDGAEADSLGEVCRSAARELTFATLRRLPLPGPTDRLPLLNYRTIA